MTCNLHHIFIHLDLGDIRIQLYLEIYLKQNEMIESTRLMTYANVASNIITHNDIYTTYSVDIDAS